MPRFEIGHTSHGGGAVIELAVLLNLNSVLVQSLVHPLVSCLKRKAAWTWTWWRVLHIPDRIIIIMSKAAWRADNYFWLSVAAVDVLLPIETIKSGLKSSEIAFGALELLSKNEIDVSRRYDALSLSYTNKLQLD